MKSMKWLLVALSLLAAQSCAFAGSTIDPTQPPTGSQLASAPVRNNFVSAFNDINSILCQFCSSNPPANPTAGQLWRNTGLTPNVVNQWSGTAWLQVATFDVLNGEITPFFGNTLLAWQQLVPGLAVSGKCLVFTGTSSLPTPQNCLSGGSFAASPPIVSTTSGAVDTISLGIDSNFAVASNQLALAPIAAGFLLGNCGASPAEPVGCSWNNFANQAIGTTNGTFPARFSGSWQTGALGTGLAFAGTVLNLQPASPSAIGGVNSIAASPHRWVNSISTAGLPSLTQPDFSDLTGSATLTQLPTIGANTVLGSLAGGTPIALTQAQLNSLITSAGLTIGSSAVTGGTAGLPLTISGGSLAQGTVTGNTTKFATSTGALTANDCVKIDANGNFIDAGAGCGAGSNTANVKDFVGGTDFTAGTTTSLTLPSSPTNAQQLTIAFDGIVQNHDTWSLAGAVITFNAAIPTNTQIVEAQWITSSTTAGVGSITDNNGNVASGAVTVKPPLGISSNQLLVSGAHVNVKQEPFGAKDDMTVVAPGTVTIGSGSGALNCTACSFTAADVGKAIGINGAGVAGVPLVTTISTFVDANDVTLAATASTALSASAQYVVYGTDNTSAFNSALTAATIVEVPPSDQGYLLAGQVVSPIGGKLVGYTVANASTQPQASGPAILNGGSLIGVISTVSPFKYAPGSLYKGLTVYYPLQRPTFTTPITYPETWTFPATTPLTNANWSDIVCVNCYYWINANIAHLEFQFEHMVGTPISRGIQDDGSGGTDLFKMLRGSLYYWTDFSENIAAYVKTNSNFITLGWIDHVLVDDIYAGSLNAGLVLNLGTVAQSKGIYGRISNFSAEGNTFSVFCSNTQAIGVAFTNVMSAATNSDFNFPSGSNCTMSIDNLRTWGTHVSSFVVQSANTTLQISNSSLNTASTVNVALQAAGAVTMIANTKFDSSPSLSAVNAQTTLMLVGDNFGSAPSVGTGHTNYRSCANVGLASSGC